MKVGPVEREEIRRLYVDEGATGQTIALHVGVSMTTVFNVLTAMRVPRRNRGRPAAVEATIAMPRRVPIRTDDEVVRSEPTVVATTLPHVGRLDETLLKRGTGQPHRAPLRLQPLTVGGRHHG